MNKRDESAIVKGTGFNRLGGKTINPYFRSLSYN